MPRTFDDDLHGRLHADAFTSHASEKALAVAAALLVESERADMEDALRDTMPAPANDCGEAEGHGDGE